MANLPPQDDKQQSSSLDKSHGINCNDNKPHSESSESIKAVAIYEIVKGVGALLGASALWFWHTDLERWLATATHTWQQKFGQFLAPQVDSTVQIAQQASKNWPLFLLLIFAYASLRFIEAYGLWQDKTWAYWFSVIGYGIFIPIELYYLVTSPFDWFKLGIFLLNIIIVIVVYRNMKRKGLI
ncbi:DUF2127 domain-containing protein [Psychrobacter urativorans]|uniref:DUF2127 domain-containing protein n=1 Tax=Psychrobacter urativorans TaxID=45610 RepID=A0A0M3V8I6_9GAMM|nr:DUF2127 domain-containing protein [Psychrobacter urativorans]ALF59243.1 hypothetical protein AOC03_03585 [Psychrobacter urativorans]